MIPDCDGRSDGQTVRRSDGQTESIIANTALCIARAMLTRCKNLEKLEVRLQNKVRALFAENKVRFARAEQYGFGRYNLQYTPCDCSEMDRQAELATVPWLLTIQSPKVIKRALHFDTSGSALT